jgi:hypothetical protein
VDQLKAEPSDVALENPQVLGQLEAAIRAGELSEARVIYRSWLQGQSPDAASASSIGELLADFSSTPATYADVAVVTLRCVSVRGLLPDPNPTNQIIRSVVQLVETATPDLFKFLGVNTKGQNFEKFERLVGAHQFITGLLDCFLIPYGDLDGLLAARKDIVGSLNHSAIRAYGQPYKVNEVRGLVEAIFGRLKKISQVSETLLDDVEASQRTIKDGFDFISENEAFLAKEYLKPFLDNVEKVLRAFLISMHGKFASQISRIHHETALKKHYPLRDRGRDIRISIPLRNLGPGSAVDVRATITSDNENVAMDALTKLLGSISPGEFSVAFDILIVEPCEQFDVLVEVEWGEIGSPRRKKDVFLYSVLAQTGNVDWAAREYWHPYSTDVAEGERFIGRRDKVRQVASKLLRTPMEPFYITGQKRIGKTSLIKAAAEFARETAAPGTLSFHYVLWGEIAHVDPSISIRQLGESLEDYIFSQLPEGVNFSHGNYDGSLSHITKVLDFAYKLFPEKKFVFIVDEFDEIHEELFLKGNLASTFFANLRAISRAKNLCLALVGGENMPYIMDRQGQKLNNFSRINLSYFSRETEWEDFQMLIRKPSEGVLEWHEEAIAEVFNSTNGNPYFAKLVCAGVARSAIAERDADITASEVKLALEAEVSTLGANSFAHLYQDGIPKAVDEREPDILRRMRVLVALARCLRKGITGTAAHIADNRASSTLAESEIVPVLNELHRRGVLDEDDGAYTPALPIFRMWLMDIGTAQLVSDSLSEELAGSVLDQENAALVHSDEVVRLVKSWPTYRGRAVGVDEVRAWYQQVPSNRDQRLLFGLLQRVRVFSESLVRERLGSVHTILRQSLPTPVRKSKKDRRRDILVTYVDGPAKSGASYASLYAEENLIAADLVITRENFREKFLKFQAEGDISAVVIIDDIAATGGTLATHVESFAMEYGDLLSKAKLRIFALIATPTAEAEILRRVGQIEGIDIDFRAAEMITERDFAFPSDYSGWNSREDYERAHALCVNLGSRIYKNSPLGIGGMGLLIVFPTTVPNNSLPILHSYSKGGTGPQWSPLFLRPTN